MSCINMVLSYLNSPHFGAHSKTHQAPNHGENASGITCTNYCLDIHEMTSNVKTKILKHTIVASKSLIDELGSIFL
jgi:hypothetical protein